MNIEVRTTLEPQRTINDVSSELQDLNQQLKQLRHNEDHLDNEYERAAAYKHNLSEAERIRDQMVENDKEIARVEKRIAELKQKTGTA